MTFSLTLFSAILVFLAALQKKFRIRFAEATIRNAPVAIVLLLIASIMLLDLRFTTFLFYLSSSIILLLAPSEDIKIWPNVKWILILLIALHVYALLEELLGFPIIIGAGADLPYRHTGIFQGPSGAGSFGFLLCVLGLLVRSGGWSKFILLLFLGCTFIFLAQSRTWFVCLIVFLIVTNFRVLITLMAPFLLLSFVSDLSYFGYFSQVLSLTSVEGILAISAIENRLNFGILPALNIIESQNGQFFGLGAHPHQYGINSDNFYINLFFMGGWMVLAPFLFALAFQSLFLIQPLNALRSAQIAFIIYLFVGGLTMDPIGVGTGLFCVICWFEAAKISDRYLNQKGSNAAKA